MIWKNHLHMQIQMQMHSANVNANANANANTISHKRIMHSVLCFVSLTTMGASGNQR